MAETGHLSGLSPIASPSYTMGRAVGKAQRAAGPDARGAEAPSSETACLMAPSLRRTQSLAGELWAKVGYSATPSRQNRVSEAPHRREGLASPALTGRDPTHPLLSHTQAGTGAEAPFPRCAGLYFREFSQEMFP